MTKMELSNFQAFWLGLNSARNAQKLPPVLFGEANDLWEAAMEKIEWDHAYNEYGDLSRHFPGA